MTDKSRVSLSIIADQLGVKPVTLRRWAEYHGAYLSSGANPPTGIARRFDGRDLEVLKTVQSLRDDGLSTARINDRLAGLTFAEIDTNESGEIGSELAPQNAPDAPGSSPAVLVALEAMQRQIDGLQRVRRDTVYLLAVGACGGLLFAAIVIGLAALYGG